MAHVLVTGAAGFIGSSLVKQLVREGHTVVGVDNLSTGSAEKLESVRADVRLEVGDIRDADFMNRVCGGIDIVFHQAALVSVPLSIDDPLASHLTNLDGTFVVLLAARDAGVRRIVYASSSSAYGESQVLPKHEGMAPAPISPYAVQKLTAEYYMQSFSKVYGLETVSLRYFNVFGPWQGADSPYSGVLARFITDMLNGDTPVIYGDGMQSRDFTYIQNVVHANLLASSTASDRVNGKVYNIAMGEKHTLLEIYEILNRLIGFNRSPVFMEPRRGDVRHSVADISLARRELCYEPKVGFEDGLRSTLDWYASRKQSFALGMAAGAPS
jgi:nucleoside-diphosphate-sugar epimerase